MAFITSTTKHLNLIVANVTVPRRLLRQFVRYLQLKPQYPEYFPMLKEKQIQHNKAFERYYHFMYLFHTLTIFFFVVREIPFDKMVYLQVFFFFLMYLQVNASYSFLLLLSPWSQLYLLYSLSSFLNKYRIQYIYSQAQRPCPKPPTFPRIFSAHTSCHMILFCIKI